MSCGPSAAVAASAVRIIKALSAASSGPVPGGNHSAAPAEPTRSALPFSKATPPNAEAKCGKASMYALGSGHVQRVAGSLLNARVRMAKTASFSATVAARTSRVVIAPRLDATTPGARLFPAIGLDAVAVGVDRKRCVIFRPVIGAHAGLAVVLAAGLERGVVEGIDRGAVLGEETEVQA